MSHATGQCRVGHSAARAGRGRQESLLVESIGSEVKELRTRVPQERSCVTWGGCINLSGPQLPHSQNRLVMVPSAQGFTQKLAHKECHHPGSSSWLQTQGVGSQRNPDINRPWGHTSSSRGLSLTSCQPPEGISSLPCPENGAWQRSADELPQALPGPERSCGSLVAPGEDTARYQGPR